MPGAARPMDARATPGIWATVTSVRGEANVEPTDGRTGPERTGRPGRSGTAKRMNSSVGAAPPAGQVRPIDFTCISIHQWMRVALWAPRSRPRGAAPTVPRSWPGHRRVVMLGRARSGSRGVKARGLTMSSRGREAARGRSRRESGIEGPAAGPARDPRSRGGRESIESFVVVFLAFLLWSLEAEGFVIPTGSMAPTLMGRHKEIACPECGYVYTVNADREVEPDRTGRGTGPADRAGGPARIAGSSRRSPTRRASRATASTS